jgi:hypothetical protein
MKPRRVFPAPRLCLLAGFLLLALPSQAFCPTGVMRQFSARPACSGCPQLGVCSEARAPGARRSVLALSMQETSPDDVTSELGASMPSQSMPLQQQVGNSSGEHMNLQKAKFGLLAAVAGLDRGAAAGSLQRKVSRGFDVGSPHCIFAILILCAAQAVLHHNHHNHLSCTTQAVLTAAEALEKESNLEPFPAGLSKIDGLWRLVYSSALSAGSGSGGGASSQSLPVFQTPDTGSFNSFGPGSQVGQVYARISSRKQKLENIVEVFLRSPLPFLPQLGKVTLNLEHKLEVRTS